MLPRSSAGSLADARTPLVPRDRLRAAHKNPIPPRVTRGQALKQTLSRKLGSATACHAPTRRWAAINWRHRSNNERSRSAARCGQKDRNIAMTATNDQDQWMPLDLEDEEIETFTALREDVPPWLQASLWDWILS